MKRILELKTIKDIRTMTDPYRLEIIRIFQRSEPESLTVKDIAREMDEPHGKVYYHVKKMIDIGAVELKRTEKINGIVAKYYMLAFDEMSSSHKNNQLDEHNDEIKSAYSDMIANLFNNHRDMFLNFINSKNLEERVFKPGEKESVVRATEVYLDEASYDELKKELEDLLNKYTKKVEGENYFRKTIFASVFSTDENESK